MKAKHLMKNLVLLLFCSLSLQLFAQNKENLIKNGQFRNSLEGWEILLSNGSPSIKAQILSEEADYKKFGLADNFVGTSFVEIDENSSIRQDVELKSIEPHSLVFAYAPRPNAGDKQLIVKVDGRAVWTTTLGNQNALGRFQYKAIKLMPEEKSAQISFYVVSLSDKKDQGVFIADVFLNEEPLVDLYMIDKH